MADAPLITTVIPTYRRPQLLARAIRSVLRQTYPHLQVCVYDNASGDETEAVVAALAREDPRVRYHCHATNIGLGANFTHALRDVSSPYFTILSDDDYHLPNFFATALRGFEAHPDAMFSAGSVVSMTEGGRITHVAMDLWERDGYFPAPEGLFEWTIPKHPDITGLLFRSEVVERVGTLDPALLNADFDFEWRIAARFPYVVSKEPCVVSVVHDTQATRTSDAGAWLLGYRTMRGHLDANDALAPDVRERARSVLASTFGDAFRILGLTAVRDRNFALARGLADGLEEELGRPRDARLLRSARRPPASACPRCGSASAAPTPRCSARAACARATPGSSSSASVPSPEALPGSSAAGEQRVRALRRPAEAAQAAAVGDLVDVVYRRLVRLGAGLPGDAERGHEIAHAPQAAGPDLDHAAQLVRDRRHDRAAHVGRMDEVVLAAGRAQDDGGARGPRRERVRDQGGPPALGIEHVERAHPGERAGRDVRLELAPEARLRERVRVGGRGRGVHGGARRDERRARLPAGPRELERRCHPALVVACVPVAGRPARRPREVDDDRGSLALDERRRGAGPQQIVERMVDGLRGEPVDVPLREDVPADQPARTGDQGDGGHGGASRSRCEITLTGSGQAMFTVGSSQRRLRALAGT